MLDKEIPSSHVFLVVSVATREDNDELALVANRAAKAEFVSSHHSGKTQVVTPKHARNPSQNTLPMPMKLTPMHTRPHPSRKCSGCTVSLLASAATLLERDLIAETERDTLGLAADADVPAELAICGLLLNRHVYERILPKYRLGV